MRDIRNQGIIRVGVRQHRANGKQDWRKIVLALITHKETGLTLRDRKGGRPLVSQDIQANRAIGIDVWVVNLGREADLGGFEWVIVGERDGEKEDAPCIWRITLDHANSSSINAHTQSGW